MAGSKGNKNAVKLKDSESKQKAFKSYCDHISKGKSKRSWYYDKDGITLSWVTMERYLLDEIEFDPVHTEIAKSKGYAIWESIVEASADGSNKNANTASLQMVMRNKFDWDKQTKEVDNGERKGVYDAVKEEHANGLRSGEPSN